MADQQSNINISGNQAVLGLNLDSIIPQVKPGMLTWAVNAVVESFDGNQVTYQNEQSNFHCVSFPEGYKVIGKYTIPEDEFTVFWLTNPLSGDCEIGKVYNQRCEYEKIINAKCLNLDINHPILKATHKKTNCSTEIYWTDNLNKMRFLDLNNLPYMVVPGSDECNSQVSSDIDCNKLNVQPNFSIPEITVTSVDSDGELTAGTYQFAIQYSNALGEPYTSFFSVTNPVPLADPNVVTLDFNYKVAKSIVASITNIDTTGFYDYFNLAVIKTINNITSVELVGTYQITGDHKDITYTGQSKTGITLSIEDIFQKYEIYDKAADVTTAQDIIIWDQLESQERISYQKIANKIKLNWQTWRLKGDRAYSDPIIASNLRGYMRDEVYAFEICFILKNGYQTDGFHIPGRPSNPSDWETINNSDVIDDREFECDPNNISQPRWKVYNTATVTEYEKVYRDFLVGITPPSKSTCIKCGPSYNVDPSKPECYVGPYQYGEFAYWESTELYPCNEEIWGELVNQPIRHHKFPDSLVTHIHDNEGYIYPIGIKLDINQVKELIRNSDLTEDQKNQIAGFKILRSNRANAKSVVAKGLINNVGQYSQNGQEYLFPNYPYNDLNPDPFIFGTSYDNKTRYTFHSPDTSFYQPSLGNILKLETVETGIANTHIVEVKNHSKYKFMSAGSYGAALGVGIALAFIPTSISVGLGSSGSSWPGPLQAIATMQTVVDLIYRIIPRRNFAYQFNSVGKYETYQKVENNGNKQRRTDLSVYANPGMISVGDEHTLNNYQRESSVYVRTTSDLPTPKDLGFNDNSRWIASQNNCNLGPQDRNIASYYASIKRNFVNQYGDIYSYETLDTGYQEALDINIVDDSPSRYIFGGDIFINKFGYKSKLPFFLDNRVGSIDESDVYYDELFNVGEVNFWFTTDVEKHTGFLGTLGSLFFPTKKTRFDGNCKGGNFFYDSGIFYLFAYGIPYFYCESEVNVDYRQAYNGKEGDFFPHVGSGIPDDWLQETNVSINFDNTYTYNRTFSKQNKENFFSHLPNDYDFSTCRTSFPFRAIFSEQQNNFTDPSQRNNWLIYKPAARFDFPQNYGKLISLEGIENKQVYARFENKTLLYNALLTAPTSAANVYLGQSLFSQQVPPLDFVETDQGYAGTQHKFFLKTEFGHISADAKRGQVFLFQGQQLKDLTTEGVSKFFTEYLDFEIQKAFPSFPIDNHFNGCGLHGIYDSKYNRLVLTKLDYKPNAGVSYIGGKLFAEGKEIALGDPNYFCNYSFTISYDFDNQAWISFHTYIPNFYVGETNYFLSGKNENTPSLWKHNISINSFNNFYGETHPYIIEYPFAYKYQDEILQSIKDYTKVYQYQDDWQSFVETDDNYFNKLILYNNQQSSGILNLEKKPKNNLSQYMKYPIYNEDSKTITFTKSDNFYQMNTFWALTKDPKVSIWKKSCENLSLFKVLNQDNCDYSKRSYKKAPLRAKDLRVRFILDNSSSSKLISQFIVTESQISYK